MKRLSLVAAFALLAACGSTPPAATAPAATPVAATAPAAPAALAAAPAAAAAPAPAANGHFAAAGTQVTVLDPEIASWARTQMYRPTLRDGKPMWCKNEKAIGSNLVHTECVSEATIVEMQRVYAANKQEILNATAGCQGGTCGRK